MTKTENLWIAAAQGNVQLLNQILDAGVNPNEVDGEVGHSPLYNATYANQLDSMDTLLRRGANPNLRLNYRSPVDGRVENNIVALMFALSPEAATKLLQAGADVNAADDAGVTPLIRAAHRGHIDVVNLLLEAGADPNFRTKANKSARSIVEARIKDFKACDTGVNSALISERVAKMERILESLSSYAGR